MRSIFEQGAAVRRVEDAALMPSPRNYNASICAHEGRVWMAYRSHRMDADGRCGVAICRLDRRGLPGRSTWIDLPRPTGGEHHEDPRLFVHAGRLHLAYVESRFHAPPHPYTCCLKYARLMPGARGAWVAVQVYHPRYGQNDGTRYEKNWSFFDGPGGKLHVIYRGEPHVVLELAGERVVREHRAPGGTVWPWGEIRGGTPPVRMPDGQWMTVFHSSLPHSVAPHWRRYYGAAYTFEPEAPFRITAISHRPILAGSEKDAHAHDPRNTDSWKPFVVFPGGCVPDRRGGWTVSYGVNDWFIALARHTDLALGDPAFRGWQPRYFATINWNLPVKAFTLGGDPRWLRWLPVPGGEAGRGVMRVPNPADVELVEDRPGVDEIGAAEFYALSGERPPVAEHPTSNIQRPTLKGLAA